MESDPRISSLLVRMHAVADLRKWPIANYKTEIKVTDDNTFIVTLANADGSREWLHTGTADGVVLGFRDWLNEKKGGV
jgi:hypothetical protein